MAVSGPDIRAGRAFVELFLKNNAFLRGMANMRRQLDDFGKQMQALGMRMTSAGVAMGTPLFMATKRFADFDDAMRQVQAVSQSTDEQFRRLTDRALQLGATTSYTAVQVALLMAELGRAGFTADQIDEMTGAVLSLARATGTDATLASGIMAASIRQFGLDASQASRVADVLTSAANKSFNTVEQLGEALSYAGPVAADFNMSIEDTLAILGGLGNVGIQASNAGTALRRLLTITGAEADKLKTIFGVAFVDAVGNARPLIDVLDEVNAATKDLGTAERAKRFNEAFGLLGITAASAIGKGVGGIRELQEALIRAGGTADTTARKMDAGLGGSFRILLSAVEGVALGIGKSLEPAVKSIADWMTMTSGRVLEYVKANGSLIVSTAKTIAVLMGVGGAFLAVGLSAQLVAAAIGGVLAIGGLLSGLLAGVLSIAGLLFTKFGALAAAAYAFRDSISGLTAPLNSFVSTARTAFATVSADFNRAWSGIVDAIRRGDFEAAMQVAILAVQLEFTKGFGSILSSLGEYWTAFLSDVIAKVEHGDISGAFATVANAIRDIFNDLLDDISDDVGELITRAASAAKKESERFAGPSIATQASKHLATLEAAQRDVNNIPNEWMSAWEWFDRKRRLRVATRDAKQFLEQFVMPSGLSTEESLSRLSRTDDKTNADAARRKSREDQAWWEREKARQLREEARQKAIEARRRELEAIPDRTSAKAKELEAALNVELAKLRARSSAIEASGATPPGMPAGMPLAPGSAAGISQAASVTFSAAGLMALGMGGTQDRMLQLTRDQKIIAQNQLKELEKQRRATEELIDRMQYVMAFRWG